MAATPSVVSTKSTSSILPVSRFPSTAEIQEAMVMAEGSIEAAEYLGTRIRELAANSKLMKNSPDLKNNIVAAVDKFVAAVKFKLTPSNDSWSGQVSEDSDLKNMQKNIAASASKELGDKHLTDLKHDYAVSADGHYIRSYTSDSGAMDSSAITNLDKLFNAWLASKDYIIKGGYLYNANADTKNEKNRISGDVVKKLLVEGGLQEYMAANGVDNINMKARDYPHDVEAQAKKEVVSAADRVERMASTDASSKVEAEETPTAGMSSSH